MSNAKKLLLAMLVLAVCFFSFLGWYMVRYSMDVVESFDVSVPNATHRLLIASQGSNYKEAVVSGVITELKEKPVFISVMDVSSLSDINVDQWNVVLILHTWESWEPQVDAKNFLDSLSSSELKKVIVVTTSGRGDYKTEGVDAITSASSLSDVPRNVAAIVQRLDLLVAD